MIPHWLFSKIKLTLSQRLTRSMVYDVLMLSMQQGCRKKATGRSCVWVIVYNCELRSQLQPNHLIYFYSLWVSSSSLHPQQPLLSSLQANQVKSTLTGVNISLSQDWRHTGWEFSQHEGHPRSMLKILQQNYNNRLFMPHPDRIINQRTVTLRNKC